ncbi:radical SAM protein [Spirochaetota bacterium]
MKYRYLFGPVHSRRLGISLGIDMLPYKTCTYNCVYCECGFTTSQINLRKEYTSADVIMKELQHFLNTGPRLDYITFAGSGEPTLHSRITDILSFLKINYPHYKTALLTNGSLFSNKKLQKELLAFDVIIPSLNSATQSVFKKINRPLRNMQIKNIIQGLISFRNIYTGELWLEIFLVNGINDHASELEKLALTVKKIHADTVQINTIDRPPALRTAKPASKTGIERLLRLIPGSEVITRQYRTQYKKACKTNPGAIILTLKRRPSTIADIEQTMGLTKSVIKKYLDVLLRNKKIKKEIINNKDFYVAVKK